MVASSCFTGYPCSLVRRIAVNHRNVQFAQYMAKMRAKYGIDRIALTSLNVCCPTITCCVRTTDRPAEGRSMPQSQGALPVTDDSWGSTLTDLLGEEYGLSIIDLAFLGGEFDRNYRATADSGECFLAKLQVRRAGHREQLWQEEILVHLAGRDPGVAVPTIVAPTRGGRHIRLDNGREALTVFNWVPGVEWAKMDQHSDALRVQLGATAARITAALEGFPPESLRATHHWDVTQVRSAISDCLADAPNLAGMDYVQTALRWFDEVEPALSALPRAVVHNDLNDNNVLVDEQRDEISGVLDFNDALYSVRVAEPTIAGAYAMLRQADPLRALGQVIGGYHAVTPLTDDELAVVYPLAALRLCVQALTWTSRANTNPTAYGSMRMRFTLPTLRRVLAVNPGEAAAHLRSVAEGSAAGAATSGVGLPRERGSGSRP
ncbi:phosphotransferase [Mycolicibacterium porcinum]|uniref:phosphotransferase n=1 Tax=Mycolicibacterium porcinum TaxID=39693 RepID=UPI0013F4DE46|nr:phosphotransferase [Mycolicibacterium porcinum]